MRFAGKLIVTAVSASLLCPIAALASPGAPANVAAGPTPAQASATLMASARTVAADPAAPSELLNGTYPDVGVQQAFNVMRALPEVATLAAVVAPPLSGCVQPSQISTDIDAYQTVLAGQNALEQEYLAAIDVGIAQALTGGVLGPLGGASYIALYTEAVAFREVILAGEAAGDTVALATHIATNILLCIPPIESS